MSLVDFIPEQYDRGRSENRLNIIYVLLFAVVMSAVVLAAYAGRSGYKRIERLSQEVDSKYRQAGQKVAAIQDQQKNLALLVTKANTAAKLIQPMPRYSVLSELCSAMPDGVTFTSIKLKTAKPKASAAAATAAAKMQFKNRTAGANTNASAKSNDEIPLILQADILIDGVAGNNEQVAGFLCNVKAVEVFRNVELVFTQMDEFEERPVHKFQMKLRLDTSIIKHRNSEKFSEKLAYGSGQFHGGRK